ncbi:MAG: cysteine--tRNA ligase [Pseudomonadota bacterium]|nr:cysteine--tRNA ligase [Pseudomonadota bacterium]
MSLHIHDTLSRKKIKFIPRDINNIRMYVCGPTVYDYAHIGNARPVVIFDVLYRLLKQLYPKVTYVRNITDVDDKINNAALETGRSIQDLTKQTTKIFQDDMANLGALKPDHEPRATQHIEGMKALIKKLLSSGHAYEIEKHVMFDVTSMPNYGRLSRLNRDELISGARVEVAPYKKDPADFVLWKPSSEDLPGWESPWGRGRPGWHLECSVMSEEFLGSEFDIHGGGQDLIFPHHENEIAQSTCASGNGFAKYWMHNGYLMAEGEKMSKSLGNFYTVNELLKEFPGEAIRLALLKTHYRQPLDFTKAGIEEAKRELDGLYRALRGMTLNPNQLVKVPAVTEALSDDLNTPLALSNMHEMASAVHKAKNTDKHKTATHLFSAGVLLGVFQKNPEDWFKGKASIDGLKDTDIEQLVAEREQARKNKNFQRSDEIRNQLAEQGISLEDGTGETTWKRI